MEERQQCLIWRLKRRRYYYYYYCYCYYYYNYYVIIVITYYYDYLQHDVLCEGVLETADDVFRLRFCQLERVRALERSAKVQGGEGRDRRCLHRGTNM